MEIDRYHRHTLIDWFNQEDIKNSRFAVIGTGAVGNEVIKNLALLGIGSIDIYDYDDIEIHNLTRSVLFREEDVGLRKVDCAEKRAKYLDPNIVINAFHGNFWDNLSLKNLIKTSCVICCVDNFEARLKLNGICALLGVDFINTGIDSRYVGIEYFPFSRSYHGACYECNLPLSVYERIEKRYSCGWLRRISLLENKVPTTIITSSIAGAIAVSLYLQRYHNSSGIHSTKIFMDTITGRSSVIKLIKNDTCPMCNNITKPANLISAKNLVNNLLYKELLPDYKNITIVSSDPIITKFRCVNCDGIRPGYYNTLFKKASLYDESFALCTTCGEKSVEIIIKHQFTIEELVNDYGGYKMPSKFIQFEIDKNQFIIELEDENEYCKNNFEDGRPNPKSRN